MKISKPLIYIVLISVLPSVSLALSPSKVDKIVEKTATKLCTDPESPFSIVIEKKKHKKCIRVFTEELYNCVDLGLVELKPKKNFKALRKCAAPKVRKSKWYKKMISKPGYHPAPKEKTK